MCFPSRTRTIALAALLATGLAGCASDIYLDRRDGASIVSGDAVATNRVTHMIDPWPPASSNRQIAYNGNKMQTAVERYRTGRIIPPVSATTSSAAYLQSQSQPALPPPPPPPPPPSKP